MKRKLAVLMCIATAVLCLGLVACGGESKSNSEYVGTWKAGTATFADMEFDATELFGDGFAITLESSGKATMTMDGDTSSLKWEETSAGFTLKDSSDSLEFTKIETGKVSLDYEDVLITFVKSS